MLRRLSAPLILMLTMITAPHTAFAAFDHGRWDRLLKAHVAAADTSDGTRVDYDAMAQQRAELRAYLDAMAAVGHARFESWAKPDRLAFLINAYNAWTVELILANWPGVASIRDLGTLLRSPWKKRFIPLLGKERTLDEIEHGMIRADGAYEEPRIHFAVNCASIGCPALRAEAYVGSRLNAQLDDAARRFLAGRTQNRLEDGRLYLSSIFKWYREDFERGWAGFNRLEDFVLAYRGALDLDEQAVQALRAGKLPIRFLDYDWRLNGAG